MRSDADKALIVGAGVTLTEAMKAAEKLAGENIHVCVVDPFTIKVSLLLLFVSLELSEGFSLFSLWIAKLLLSKRNALEVES